jgi:hypothetical protein
MWLTQLDSITSQNNWIQYKFPIQVEVDSLPFPAIYLAKSSICFSNDSYKTYAFNYFKTIPKPKVVKGIQYEVTAAQTHI